jgi:UDP-glucuronate 4-epimerase
LNIIITGCAGFIGSNLALDLLSKGHCVIGIDNLNDYYDVALKKARLVQLQIFPNFTFFKADINDSSHIQKIISSFKNITHLILLGAQAGVRHSIKMPMDHINTNVNGLVSMLEIAKNIDSLEHIIFASSSSVYGNNSNIPFCLEDVKNQPSSIYAATKIAGESIAYSYSHIYKLPITVLRFFTVYGKWGRPDMAIYNFTKSILEETPIKLFNHGDMKRDFTYIDDIVKGIIASIEHRGLLFKQKTPYKIYNLGRGKGVDLRYCLSLIEEALGKKAKIILTKMPNTEMVETLADISVSRLELGFNPEISIEEGIVRFCEWYESYMCKLEDKIKVVILEGVFSKGKID